MPVCAFLFAVEDDGRSQQGHNAPLETKNE